MHMDHSLKEMDLGQGVVDSGGMGLRSTNLLVYQSKM
jgi:hypothetical protein